MVEMITEATIVQGDYGQYLEFVLYESDSETLYDLTNATTVTIHLKKYGESTLTIDNTCNIYSTSGTIRYTLEDGDTDKVGKYIGDIEVIEPGAITTWTPFWVDIIEEVG